MLKEIQVDVAVDVGISCQVAVNKEKGTVIQNAKRDIGGRRS
jgi:hypothetical protein